MIKRNVFWKLNNLFPKSLTSLRRTTLWSFVFSLLICFFFWHPMKEGSQNYEDIIVGNITWIDFYKMFDYNMVCLFLGSFLFLWFLSNFILNKNFSTPFFMDSIVRKEKKDHNLITYFLISFLSYTFSLWVTRGYLPSTEFLLLSVLLSMAYFSMVKKKFEDDFFTLKFVSAGLTILFFYLTYAALLIGLKLLLPNLFIENVDTVNVIGFLVLFIVSFFVGRNLFFRDLSEMFWIKLVYKSQLLLPILLMVVVKDIYQQDNNVIQNNVPIYSKIIVCLICISFIYSNIKQLLLLPHKKKERDLNHLVLRSSVVVISIFLAYKTPVYSSFISDDFHLGELILPWQQNIQFQQPLYSGFVSVQGIMGLLYGGINDIFFDDTVSSFPLAYSLLPVIFVAISAYYMCALVGNIAGMFLSLFILPMSDRFYLVAPILLILSNSYLLKNSFKWLVVWMCVSVIHCFYNPSIGLALSVASLPLAILIVNRIFIEGKLSIGSKKIYIIFIFLTLIVLVWFLAPYLKGWVEFLRYNGSSNTTAYGIGIFQQPVIPEWFPKWWPYPIINFAFWEMIRIGGWLFGLVLLWYFLFRHLIFNIKKGINELLTPVVVFLTISIIFLLLLIPYSLGRVDPGTLSRPGTASMLTIGLFLPVILVLCLESFSNKKMVFLILGFLLGIKSSFSHYDLDQIALKAVETIKVPHEAKFVNGEEIGIPKIGNIFILSDKLNDVQTFKDITSKILKENETYYDLTNRSLYYYVLDKRVPSPYSADYLAMNYEIQNQVLKRLELERPPLIWLGPNIRHDGGPSSLRSYRLYRWIMGKDYVYYEKNGFQFLVEKSRAEKLKLPILSVQEEDQKLSAVFHQKELQSIPIAWGRNMKNLNWRFKVSDIKATQSGMHNLEGNAIKGMYVKGNDPFVIYSLENKIKGKDADFISIELDSDIDINFRGQIFWSKEGGRFSEENSFQFNARKGKLLIPMGSHPNWLKAENLKNVRVDVDGFPEGQVLRIKKISFLKLNY